jgi:hypothetical protein
LRISSNKKAIKAPMEPARKLLERFVTDRKAERIDDDLSALSSRANKSELIIDIYFADLAVKHRARFATLDQASKHVAVDVIF